MERCFIATKENQYIKDYEKYHSMRLEQKEFVVKFFEEKGVEANTFYIDGDGTINKPFDEYWKKDINLSIEPTENDFIKYDAILTKPNERHGLRTFKKNSGIAKEFAQKCIDERIVINIHKPSIGDYFNCIGWANGCRWGMFNFENRYYLRVESESLNKEETPIGLNEIKLSEYYLVKEKFEQIK